MDFPSLRTNRSKQAGFIACLLLFCALSPVDSHAQSRIERPPARYVQFGQPDQAEGRKLLEKFLQQGIAGDYYLEFDLHVLPRRGDTRVVTGGRLWGSRNEIGPVSRVEIPAIDGNPARRLLVQNGAAGSIWISAPAFAAKPLGIADPSAQFSPLAGTDLTAFDLQMPFLYWNDFVFEGIAPVRGRPAHVFLLYPPAEITALKPALTGVRVYLDTQFGALVQSQQIGAEERVLKTMTVLDLKKVDDQWMVKTIDLRDETTRNKTQFVVTGAALGLDFSGGLFDPASLGDAIQPPASERIHHLNP